MDRLQSSLTHLLTNHHGLTEELDLLNNIIDLAPQCVQIVHADGRHFTANKAFKRVFSVPTHSDWRMPEDPRFNSADWAERWRMLGRAETPERPFFVILHPEHHGDNGGFFPVRPCCMKISTTPFLDENNELKFVLLIWDEIAKTDCCSQTGQDDATPFDLPFTNIAERFSHSVNSLLTQIISHTELAMDALPRPAEAGRSMASVLRAALRMNQVLEGAARFSQAKRVDARPLDLRSLLIKTTETFAADLPERMTLQTNITPNPCLTAGDPVLLREMIDNLLSNARQAMPDPGSIVVVLRPLKRAEASSNNFFELTITDDGCGIPRAMIDRIFEPFFTTRLNDEAAGLGLAYVKRAATEHGGSVTVESRVGFGSTFTVLLPRLDDTPDTHR